jgi:arabinogalactan oligomer/maltooligosaccharide transport system substrate-binding protein
MKKTLLLIVTLLAAFSLMAAQCAGTGATEPASAVPEAQPTEGPAETEVAATEAPAETEAAVTEAPAGEAVTISVWHGYIETEEATFSQAVSDFMSANPNITIDVLAVPFQELQNKFQTEVAAGGGPTLVTGPQDRMAGYAEAGLLSTLLEDLEFLDPLVDAAVEGGRIDGELYGIPLNNKVVAMFYNTSMVDTPPEDFDQLLQMAAENGMALTADWFHNYMWAPTFGAQFFDENYKVVVDSPEGAEAYSYFKQVCESEGVTCDANDGDMDTLFRQGEVAFRLQGPWASGDFIADLGEENVAVTNIPQIPGQDFPHPWNQSEMISMNVDATDQERAAALDLIEYLVSADVQKMFLEQANWIPANETVDTTANPVVGGFLDQVPYSDPFPVAPELGATWDPMQNAITKILEEVATPEEALSEAAQVINTANNKQ